MQELGINAVELVRMPLDRQMGIVADRFSDVGTQADRVRLAMKLLDSEGASLVNTLKLGSTGLANMASEAKDLGLAVSRMDLAKVEAFNDEMDRLSKLTRDQGGLAASGVAIISSPSQFALLHGGCHANLGHRLSVA